jgi:hypothetical protein
MYVVLSLFWTLAGLGVGYWLGRAGRLEALMTTPPTETPVVAVVLDPAATKRRKRDYVIGLVIVLLAVASVASMSIVLTQQQRYIERQSAVVSCQNAYNRANSEAYAERAAAAAKERAGQRALLQAAFSPTQDRAAAYAAYQQYLALLGQADEQREANPLPVQDC